MSGREMHPDDVSTYIDTLARIRRNKGLKEPSMYAVHQVFRGTSAMPGEYIGSIIFTKDPVTNRRIIAFLGENNLDLALYDAGAAALAADDAIKFNTSSADTPFAAALRAVQAHIAEIQGDVNMRIYNLDRKSGGFYYQNTVNYALQATVD